jgi:hypothetical protein
LVADLTAGSSRNADSGHGEYRLAHLLQLLRLPPAHVVILEPELLPGLDAKTIDVSKIVDGLAPVFSSVCGGKSVDRA